LKNVVEKLRTNGACDGHLNEVDRDKFCWISLDDFCLGWLLGKFKKRTQCLLLFLGFLDFQFTSEMVLLLICIAFASASFFDVYVFVLLFFLFHFSLFIRRRDVPGSADRFYSSLFQEPLSASGFSFTKKKIVPALLTQDGSISIMETDIRSAT
jgi:dolichyl-phosphate-mannose--protein O-mannosyl transferase